MSAGCCYPRKPFKFYFLIPASVYTIFFRTGVIGVGGKTWKNTKALAKWRIPNFGGLGWQEPTSFPSQATMASIGGEQQLECGCRGHPHQHENKGTAEQLQMLLNSSSCGESSNSITENCQPFRSSRNPRAFESFRTASPSSTGHMTAFHVLWKGPGASGWRWQPHPGTTGFQLVTVAAAPAEDLTCDLHSTGGTVASERVVNNGCLFVQKWDTD